MHQLMWRTATPLWESGLVTPAALRSPAILRFAGDDFMEQMSQGLTDTAVTFEDLIARRETWRTHTTPSERIGVIDPGDEEEMPHLKLYQPAQNRFYLAGANLVCRRAGLPDHRVGGEERVSMLVRRLDPDRSALGGYREQAWDGSRWRRLGDDLIHPDEERLPLVATVHHHPEGRRRLLTALIPVGAREAYEAAVPRPTPASDDAAPASDPRLARLIETVIRPLAELHEASGASPRDEDLIAEVFVFSTLDLADYVRRIAGRGDVLDGEAPSHPLTRFLDEAAAGDGDWLAALREVEAARTEILLGELPAELDVVGLTMSEVRSAIRTLAGDVGPSGEPNDWDLYTVVRDGLPETVEEVEELVPQPADESGSLYVVRCLYEKEKCPIRPEWLSEASETFTMASFFDPDAPGRDIRIAMPFDTSPAGLRKFPRNVSVMLSNELRKQMARVEDIKIGDLEDGNLGSGDGLDLGMICSLSIPIITIAALILLMIIVSILNIVFWWIPLFKVCIPVSGSDG